MKIGIHKNTLKGYFSERWIPYCEQKNIPYKLVNCYGTDIMAQLADCDALMWHFSHADARDFLFAKELIAATEASGKLVFPNSKSCWHFDDKIGQKYLLEAIGAPLAPTYVFYSKADALEWAGKTSFPKVFKLRNGAGSANVRLVEAHGQAVKLIHRAFGKGFRSFDRIAMLKDAIQKGRAGKITPLSVMKAAGKIFVKSSFERVRGRESGYIYFQDFYPNNDFDMRVIVIGDKAFAIKRLTRRNDFRASGSGMIIYDRDQLDPRCVNISFSITGRIGADCLTLDFVYDERNDPVVLEISFGFVQSGYDNCQGYWDRKLQWYPGRFTQQDWMVDYIVEKLSTNNIHGK